jgi:RNA-binding protein YlmH
MTKAELLLPYQKDPELRLRMARLLDKHELTRSREVPSFCGFFSPEEQEAARVLLSKLPRQQSLFFGGYEGAQRQICAFLPDWMDEEDWQRGEHFPICALEGQVPPMASLNHRDYLGSLMALGISREKFGDILPLERGFQLIMLKELLPVLESQWEKVGRYPVRLAPIALEALCPQEPKLRTLRDTVASLRLDAVLAAGFQTSRSRAADLVGEGRVQRNHRPCERADQQVEPGDVLSCRGLGKFILKKAEGKSKKGRIIIELDRYE